jgi:hypothetical protein
MPIKDRKRRWDDHVVRALPHQSEATDLPAGEPRRRCVGYWLLSGHASRCRNKATKLREGFALCETDARRATAEVFVGVK